MLVEKPPSTADTISSTASRAAAPTVSHRFVVGPDDVTQADGSSSALSPAPDAASVDAVSVTSTAARVSSLAPVTSLASVDSSARDSAVLTY